MEPPLRGFDRLLYIVLIVAVFGAANWRADKTTTPQPPRASSSQSITPPEQNQGGRPLPAPSIIDPQVDVEAGLRTGPSTGTAFAVGPNLWLTAEHVVAGCNRIALRHPNGTLIAGTAELSGKADAALIRSRSGRATAALPVIADTNDLRLGQSGYHVGFPQGSPGEVSSQLLGRMVLNTRGAVRRREAILAWSETARSPGLRGSLGGLSGGPAFSANGKVIGVTIAESPRRGRIFTTAPRAIRSLNDTITASQIGAPADQASPITPEGFATTANQLRRQFQVAQVLCR